MLISRIPKLHRDEVFLFRLPAATLLRSSFIDVARRLSSSNARQFRCGIRLSDILSSLIPLAFHGAGGLIVARGLKFSFSIAQVIHAKKQSRWQKLN